MGYLVSIKGLAGEAEYPFKLAPLRGTQCGMQNGTSKGFGGFKHK